MTIVSAPDIFPGESNAPIAKSIEDRLSQELIIALVGPVGSGVSTAAAYIRDMLVQTFAYDVAPIIKPSSIIKSEAVRVGDNIPEELPFDQYILRMQDAGNSLRERFGGDYLAEKIVETIYTYRNKHGGYTASGVVIPGRRAYIIDSLKNPDELDLLKQIYGETLCVIGVFAPDAQRKKRLTDAQVPADQINAIIDRDQGEIATFGQKTRKLFVRSDFFVCNDRRPEELRSKISRLLEIMFDTSVHTPTRAESAMYEASAAAAKSACMSRQVGAAIVSASGELISIGWNDVPRFGGGLYNEDDQSTLDPIRMAVLDEDNRCFKWGGCICHNEVRRNRIVEKLVNKVSQSGLLKRGATAQDVTSLFAGSEIESLIEFSRSIHAEMEAILGVAREGKHSLVGATLFTNTYPCHNCARHIVASGIKSVIYIEPYLKSLAIDLHYDAISEDPEDKTRVTFRQYDGVAPRSYIRLFRPHAERKRNGRLDRPDPRSALPVFRIQLDSLVDYEAKVLVELSSKEQNSTGVEGRFGISADG